MGMTLPYSAAAMLFAAALLAVAPAAVAQPNGRGPSRHVVVPYDSNMSAIDRMARRNMERRHIERRMRFAPPPGAPRRPGPRPRR